MVAYDAERRPLLLLPLALQPVPRHSHCASFMGGKHATFNMALYGKEFAASATSADLGGAGFGTVERSRSRRAGADQQPMRWRDLPNPMALLPHQPSANDCPLLTMAPGAAPASLISNSFRRRLKSKERKLQALAGYRYHVARGRRHQPPARLVLPRQAAADGRTETAQRVRRARRRGVHPRRLPDAARGGGRVIDIHALECDEEVIAIFAGVADGHRFSMMFNTYTMSDNARYSPGLILMRDIIDHYAGQGYRALDLGIGSDEYKRMFCKDDEPIFDSFIPLSLRGRIAASAMSGGQPRQAPGEA